VGVRDSCYGLANVLLDRDGRVVGTHLRYGNGPLMAEAPAMADLLCDLSPVRRRRTCAPVPQSGVGEAFGLSEKR
jgi:hypothetical protein